MRSAHCCETDSGGALAAFNFNSDLQELIEQKLTKLGHLSKPEDDLDTILMRYLNLISRTLPVIQWTVKKSTNITAKKLSKEICAGLKNFIRKAELGEDLTPYMSTKMACPDYADLMFYNWGIYHFHLGIESHPKKKYKGFVARTNELLFGVADPATAILYLIDIHSHKNGFTNQDLLGVLEENWVEVLEPYTPKGVFSVVCHPSNAEIGDLRKAVNIMIQTPGGRVLAPMGGGMTSAKTSTNNRIEANKAELFIRQLEDCIIKQREPLENHFRSTHRKSWGDLQFKMTAFGEKIKIEEMTTHEVVYEQPNLTVWNFS